MRIYRRMEITAFRRQVSTVSGDRPGPAKRADVAENDAYSLESVEAASEEEMKILIDAARRLLEDNAVSE